VFRNRIRWSKNLVAKLSKETVDDIRGSRWLASCCGSTYLEIPERVAELLIKRARTISADDVAEAYRVEFAWEVFLVLYGTRRFIPAKEVLDEKTVQNLVKLKVRLNELVGPMAIRPVYVSVLRDGTVVY
jgi:hypothetical protein